MWDSELDCKQDLEDANAKENDPHLPFALRLEQKKRFLYAKTPAPITVSEVEGVEVKVERLPMRYEALEDILEELPDGLRETISHAWGH
jgi:hypothetical protein